MVSVVAKSPVSTFFMELSVIFDNLMLEIFSTSSEEKGRALKDLLHIII